MSISIDNARIRDIQELGLPAAVMAEFVRSGSATATVIVAPCRRMRRWGNR
jgi:hypothetical protein